MRKIFPLMILLALAGCGPSGTPLTHALSALRKGDRQDFLAAKAEADEAVKTAIQPGDDLCTMNMMDVAKYGTVAAIGRLDHDDLFKLSEDARLLYALKVAGTYLPIEHDSFLAQAPLVRQVVNPGRETNALCAGEKDKMMDSLESAGSKATAADEARMRFLQGWMADKKSEYGSGFDDHMRSAVISLQGSGYSADWPAKIDFITG